MDFPVLESPGDDNRGLTAWYDMAACDGVSVRGSDGEVVEKHNWAAQEITGKDWEVGITEVCSAAR